MKLSKQERDEYVEKHYKIKTNNQLAEDTGWSLTTIKSIKRRLGLVKKTEKLLEVERYCLDNYDGVNITDKDIATLYGMKHDNVRDILKSLGMYKGPSDIAADLLKLKYSGRFKIVSRYAGTKTNLRLECRSCGGVYDKLANFLVTMNFQCPKCSEKTTTTDTEGRRDFAEKALRAESKAKGSGRYKELSESLEAKGLSIIRGVPLNNLSKIEVECVNGHTRSGSVRNMLRYGCSECEKDQEVFYLYILEGGGMYKVGVSKEVSMRVKRIAESSGIADLRCIHSFKGYKNEVYNSEKYWHEFFADKNCNLGGVFDGSTEFFHLSPQDLELILKTPLIN